MPTRLPPCNLLRSAMAALLLMVAPEPTGTFAKPAGSTGCRAPDILIENVMVRSPGSPTERKSIIVRDGTIALIRSPGEYSSLSAMRIDGRSLEAIPGLIDAHVHVRELPIDLSGTDVTPLAVSLPQLLTSGVTTVRTHLLDTPTMKQLTHAGSCVPSPDVVGGGGGFFGGSSRDADSERVWAFTDETTARNRLFAVRAAGGSWVALHDVDKFQPKELIALRRLSQAAGIRLMVQSDEFVDLERALALPADTLEYFNRSTSAAYPAELVQQFQRPVAPPISAPLGYYRRLSGYLANPPALRPSQLRFYPPAVAQSADAALARRLEKIRRPARAEQAMPTLATKFRQLREAGARFITASDAGSDAGFHADAIWWEIAALRSFGLSADEALAAATIEAAQALGLPDRGRIDVGMSADIVLLDKPFTADALDERNVHTVIRKGVVFVTNHQPVPLAWPTSIR